MSRITIVTHVESKQDTSHQATVTLCGGLVIELPADLGQPLAAGDRVQVVWTKRRSMSDCCEITFFQLMHFKLWLKQVRGYVTKTIQPQATTVCYHRGIRRMRCQVHQLPQTQPPAIPLPNRQAKVIPFPVAASRI